MKTYAVNLINHIIPLNGKGDHPLWGNAGVLKDFQYPWEEINPPLTVFRALHSPEWLYCCFLSHDDNVRVFQRANDKGEIIRSDRAEIFFRQSEEMAIYYCLEIDPLGRVFDCKGSFYRKLDASWNWPDGHLKTAASKTMNGYSIEVAISKASLRQLGLINGDELHAGLFRAECLDQADGGDTFRWISWVKPTSPTPDFHVPSAFGIFRLMA